MVEKDCGGSKRRGKMNLLQVAFLLASFAGCFGMFVLEGFGWITCQALHVEGPVLSVPKPYPRCFDLLCVTEYLQGQVFVSLPGRRALGTRQKTSLKTVP